MIEAMTRWNIKPEDFPSIGSIWLLCTTVRESKPVIWIACEATEHTALYSSLRSASDRSFLIRPYGVVFTLPSDGSLVHYSFKWWNHNLERGFVKKGG